MRVPFLIFAISGFVSVQIEPLATRAISAAVEHARTKTPVGRILRAGDARIDCLRSELADVQMDLMKVFETDRARTTALQSREARLKYAVRAEEIRRDEITQCANQKTVRALKTVAQCAIASEKPRS